MVKKYQTDVLADSIFHDEDAGRRQMDAILWHTGPVCPHCGMTDGATPLQGKSHRTGLYQRKACRSHFIVINGTVMESSYSRNLRTFMIKNVRSYWELCWLNHTAGRGTVIAAGTAHCRDHTCNGGASTFHRFFSTETMRRARGSRRRRYAPCGTVHRSGDLDGDRGTLACRWTVGEFRYGALRQRKMRRRTTSAAEVDFCGRIVLVFPATVSCRSLDADFGGVEKDQRAPSLLHSMQLHSLTKFGRFANSMRTWPQRQVSFLTSGDPLA